MQLELNTLQWGSRKRAQTNCKQIYPLAFLIFTIIFISDNAESSKYK